MFRSDTANCRDEGFTMKIEKQLVVINKLGLHARAAALLVKRCAGFDSQIKLSNGSREVDAKSIMGVMMLAASQGTSLELVVEGEDAEAAAEMVSDLFENYFEEGE